MQKGVKFSEDGQTLRAYLSGEIDHHLAKGVREETDAMLFRTKPRLLILDFSDVRFMDSSGIALIIGRADICGELGCRVRITGLSEAQRKLVRLSGVEKLKALTID